MAASPTRSSSAPSLERSSGSSTRTSPRGRDDNLSGSGTLQGRAFITSSSASTVSPPSVPPLNTSSLQGSRVSFATTSPEELKKPSSPAPLWSFLAPNTVSIKDLKWQEAEPSSSDSETDSDVEDANSPHSDIEEDVNSVDSDTEESIEEDDLQQEPSRFWKGVTWLKEKAGDAIGYALNLPKQVLTQPIHIQLTSHLALGNCNVFERGVNFGRRAISHFRDTTPPSYRPLQSQLDNMTFDRDLKDVSDVVNARYNADEEYRLAQMPRQPLGGRNARSSTLSLIRQPAHPNLTRQRTWLPPSSPPIGQPEPSSPPPAESNASDPQAEWAATERGLRTRVIRSAVSFVAYRFFNESILGNRPDNVMTYYNSIINAENPRETYLNQLTFISKLLAYIILPIIEWIVGLIFHNKEERLTGIAYIAERAEQYFSNPSNRTRAFEEALETCSNYFRTLNIIVDRFHQKEGGTLSYQQFLRRELDSDLELQGIPREAIYGNAHRLFIEMINIRSDVPIIGGLLDKIIKSSLKPVLDRANVIQSAINQGLGSIRPNSSFAYGVMRFFVNTLNDFTQALTSPRGEQQSTSFSLFDNADSSVNPNQQRILRDLFQRLIQFLPYEKVSEEVIEKRKAQRTDGRVDQEIIEALEKTFVQAIQSFIHATSVPETQRYLWQETLELIESIFDPSPPRTDEECLRIQNQAKSAITLFLDAILEIIFKEDLSKSKKEKEIEKGIELTAQTREDVQSSVEILRGHLSHIKDHIPTQNIREIERTLIQICMERSQLFSKLYNMLIKAYNAEKNEVVISLPQYTEWQFRQGIDLIAKELDKMRGFIQQILSHTQFIRGLRNLLDTTRLVIPHLSTPQNLFPLDIITEWIQQRINPLIPALEQEADRQVVEETVQALSARIDTIRRTHATATQKQTLLSYLRRFETHTQSITEANEQLQDRPDTNQFQAINEAITLLKLNLVRINATNTAPQTRYQAISSAMEQFDILKTAVEGLEFHSENSSEQLLEGAENNLSDMIEALKNQMQQLAPLHDSSEEGDSSPEPSNPLASSIDTKMPLTSDELALTKGISQNIERLESRLRQIQDDNRQLMIQITQEIALLTPILDEVERIEQREEVAHIRSDMDQIMQHMANPQDLGNALGQISQHLQQAILTEQTEQQQMDRSVIKSQEKLSHRFNSLVEYLTGRIASYTRQLDQEHAQLHNTLETMQGIQATITDPDPLKIDPTLVIPGLNSHVNSKLKSEVHSKVRALAIPALEFIVNPMHLEQLLLRCVFSRLSLE